VRLREPKLRGVLDRDDPLCRIDVGGQRIEERGLAGAGAAADDDVQPAADGALEQLGMGRLEARPGRTCGR
jgi:hypothetical protein